MARRRTEEEIASRLHELLNQQADLEHQLASISTELRRDVEALTSAEDAPDSPSARHIDLDRVLALLSRLAVAPTETDATEVIVGAARELLPGTQGAICRPAGNNGALATVAVWDHGQQWHQGYRQADGSPAPEGIKRGVNDGPSGEAEAFSIQGFGLSLGELRVWDSASAESLEPEDRQGRGELIARCAGLVLGGMHLQQALRVSSVMDPLTGLYHRGYFRETLEQECRRCHRRSENLTLLMIDIDRFGPFNDAHGPSQGDRMLQSIAEHMRLHARASDILCRYSGERFAIILPEALATTSQPRADDLRAGISRIEVDDGRVTVSGGLAAYPEHGLSGSDLIEAAETAIIEARHQGGDRITMAVPD